jgi:serine acetyltransferase
MSGGARALIRLETTLALIRNRALFSCTRGTGVHVMYDARLRGKIALGPGTVIHRFALLEARGGWIKLGRNCCINSFCVLYGHGGLDIGDDVHIATHTVIVPSNHNFANPDVPIRKQGLTKKGIRIESDVWIGANVCIMDGVTIGRGCVVAAGAVVTKSIPPMSVVAGVPARIISARGKSKTISAESSRLPEASHTPRP